MEIVNLGLDEMAWLDQGVKKESQKGVTDVEYENVNISNSSNIKKQEKKLYISKINVKSILERKMTKYVNSISPQVLPAGQHPAFGKRFMLFRTEILVCLLLTVHEKVKS